MGMIRVARSPKAWKLQGDSVRHRTLPHAPRPDASPPRSQLNAPPRPPHLAPLLQQLKQTALPRVAADADHRLALGDAIDLKQLHSLAEREPALAFAILQSVNSKNSADDELRGLQQGIHRLGSGGVQRLLRGLPALRYQRDQPGHLLSLQAMASSRLAWLYLAQWLRSALASDEDARLSTLTLLGVARWKLPLAAPALAAEIESRVQAGERRTRVERELLGADLDTLNAWHLQDLGLRHADALLDACRWSPKLLAQAAHQVRSEAQAPDLSTGLKAALRERGLLCGLAQTLALETQVDWHSLRTRRLLQTLAAVSARPAEEVQRGVHRQALFASHEAMFGSDVAAPAAGLLRPPRPPRALRRQAGVRLAGAPAAAAVSAATSQAAHPPTTEDPAEGFAERCQAGHPDLRSLLGDSVRLFAALGLKRCALFLRDTDPAMLGCHFSVGFAPGEADRGLRLPSQAPGLVKLLLAQPGVAFRVSQSQRPSIGSKLPAALAEWPPESGMLLATVAVQGRAVGFWWADAGQGGAEASLETFARFRRSVESFGPAFTRQLARRNAGASRQ